MDNQNNNQDPITPLPPLQPLSPNQVSANKGFSFDVPKPIKGEELIASSRVDTPVQPEVEQKIEMPLYTPKPVSPSTSTQSGVSSATLSSFADFKPSNAFNGTTQSSNAQLFSGDTATPRSSKKIVTLVIVVVILLLVAGGVVYAYPKIKPTIQNLFATFTKKDTTQDNSIITPIVPDATATLAPIQPEQYITSSPSLDAAPVTPVQEEVVQQPIPQKAPVKFPKSGIGPEEGPL